MLKVGDWVTQYNTGYWQVVAVFAKYAEADAEQNGVSWKKGDRIGDWAVVKKGFTLTMKPDYACECVDSRWCRPVSVETRAAIEAAFAEKPKTKELFLASSNMPQPSVVEFAMNLPADQVEAFRRVLDGLPERFTVERLWEVAHAYRRYVVKPPAPFVLRLRSYLWEMDRQFDVYCFQPELVELEP